MYYRLKFLSTKFIQRYFSGKQAKKKTISTRSASTQLSCLNIWIISSFEQPLYGRLKKNFFVPHFSIISIFYERRICPSWWATVNYNDTYYITDK